MFVAPHPNLLPAYTLDPALPRLVLQYQNEVGIGILLSVSRAGHLTLQRGRRKEEYDQQEFRGLSYDFGRCRQV